MDLDLIDRLLADLQGLRRTAQEGGDETERAPAPEEDFRRVQWLAGILAHSRNLIAVLDTEGTVLYVSGEHHGKDPAAFVGRTAAEFLMPTSRRLLQRALQTARSGEQPESIEFSTLGGYHWTARVVPIQREGSVRWLLLIVSDITAQRKAEAALEVKEQQLLLALDASGMGQWSWDVGQDRVTWDAASKRIFQWPEEDDDITFASFLERVHPSDRERVERAVRTAVEVGEYRDLQCRVVLPDSRERWILCKGRVLEDADGQASTLVGGVLDITHGKRTDEHLQRSAKLEAIGQLAGGIAHEFNNLLVAILGNIDLGRSTEIPQERNARLDDARAAAERAADLTRELLTFSRQQPLDQQDVDCNQLLHDTLGPLRRVLPKTIEVDVVRTKRLPRIFGDRGQLEQVIVNLCINARDAMPNGGRLTIETRVERLDARLLETHPWCSPGDYASLRIEDTGTGIPHDVVDHVFEPFFTTKQEGSGLGLATAYGIVKRHRGMIQLSSEEGKGTRFTMYLPIPSRSEPRVQTGPDASPGEKRQTVLLAEDEDAVRAVVTRMLTRSGYRVISAVDGRDAIQHFEDEQDGIDVLLFDAVMPKMSGMEALLEIRERKPSLPAILCSGYSESSADWRVPGKPIVFLAKPYEPDTLLRVLRGALDDAANEPE